MKTKDQIQDEVAFKYYACSWVEILRGLRRDKISMTTFLEMEDEIINLLFSQQRDIIKDTLNELCVNPDDTGITQSEHFCDILKMIGVEFVDTKQGWKSSATAVAVTPK